MYRYETHLHTAPVSACAHATVRQSLEFYKSMDYDGVFITNHFIDSNISVDRSKSYAERIEYFFSDYEEGVRIGKELGIKVFSGAELSMGGTDFLVYGLDKQWFLAHPEIEQMKKSDELALLRENGALLIHAHPFREAGYIDHIRLFPRHVHGVEIINACRTDFENKVAAQYAETYGLLPFAGSDNHSAEMQTRLAGMESEAPIEDVQDFMNAVQNRKMQIFTIER